MPTNERGELLGEAAVLAAKLRQQAQKVGGRLTTLLLSEQARDKLAEVARNGKAGDPWLLIRER